MKYSLPYDGAKEMLLVEDVDNRVFLESLFNAVYNELPEPKKNRKIKLIRGSLMRVTGNNPAAALYTAQSYYKKKFGV